jgi:hypothetical protein
MIPSTPARFVTVFGAIFCRSAAWRRSAIRQRQRTLRYRNLLVRQMVQMKNKIGMLMHLGFSSKDFGG